MKLHYLLFLMIAILILSKGNTQTKTDQIIIKFKSPIKKNIKELISSKSFGMEALDNIITHKGLIKIQKIIATKELQNKLFVLKFIPSTDIFSIVEKIQKLTFIDYAEPDYKNSTSGVSKVVPNDTYFSRQWGLNNNGSFSYSSATVGADIDMEDAWAIQTGDTNIIVGVLDTGIKIDHPDFTGRIWRNYAEMPGNNTDEDADGYIDDVYGWNFAYDNNNVMDDYGHGTNVAGILGANGNNGVGYTGVDWKCKLMAMKTQDSTGGGYNSAWVSAIYYAVNKGVGVINMSVGSRYNTTTVAIAINYALAHNVVVVACMMNDNTDSVYYPAKYSGVIAVGATNPNDSRANPFFWSGSSGSNYGSHISVVAPGNYIFGLDSRSNTNYNRYWGGTSQATPHVAGLASLLLAQDNTRTPAQIKSLIEITAQDRVGPTSEDTPGWDKYYGYGRINAFKALNYYTNIYGSLITVKGKSLNNVVISAHDNNSGTTLTQKTDTVGKYKFQLIKGNSVTVKAAKNNDLNTSNGISILDIALVQSHLLQITTLNNPYKLIAADVNGDGKISTLDIVYMKRLILGLDTTFTNTTNGQKRLWAFVDSSYSFLDTTNPFPFKDSISFIGSSANKTNQTFIGVKLGDVNWDWNPLVAKMPNPVFVKPKKLNISQ